MQRKVIVFIVVAILALAAVSIFQSRKAAALKAEASAARLEAEARSRAIEDQQMTIDRLQKQKGLLNQKLHELANREESTASLPSNSPVVVAERTEPGSNSREGRGGFLARMMADPEMKKMMRTQQKLMLDQMYGPLFKQLTLSPEESEKLTALMLERQMNAVEKGTAMLNPDTDKAALQRTMADDKKQFEGEIKNLLGDERYRQYEEFNTSLPDRMALNQLKSQFGDSPLTEDQGAQLLNAMTEERQRAATDGKAVSPPDLESMVSEEAINRYFAEQEAINQRVVARAASVLTPKQVEILGRSLANNLVLQRTGMSMARTILSGKKDPGTAEALPAK